LHASRRFPALNELRFRIVGIRVTKYNFEKINVNEKQALGAKHIFTIQNKA